MNSQEINQLLEKYARGQEDALIMAYLADGPQKLRKDLKLSVDEWLCIFDYLVFEHNLLYKCVVSSADFFVQEYIKHGMTHIREILDVIDEKYNAVLEVAFDLIAISNEGLYYHVLDHRDRYVQSMRVRGSDFVRKVLGVGKDKYNENWEKVLNILLKATVDDIFSEKTFDDSLKAFAMISNGMREHRPVYKYKG